jgi:hypothetical protein
LGLGTFGRSAGFAVVGQEDNLQVGEPVMFESLSERL